VKRAPVTIVLLIAMAAGYLVQIAVSVHHYTSTSTASTADALLSTFTQDQSLQWESIGAITPYTLRGGDFKRLVIAPFLHGGIVHLLLNGWALLQFGVLLEWLLGSVWLIAIWFVCGVTASATSAFFLRGGISVGASGAIFGIIGVLVVVLGRQQWQHRLRIRIAIWAVLTIFLGFQSPAIDNAAHVGGFIAGLLVGLPARRLPHRFPAPERN
jgi:membrane associated rhomboid family serine protease